MERRVPQILSVDFFNANCRPMRAKVAARDFSSLSYRLDGRVSVTDGEKELISTPDTLLFMPRGTAYSTEVFEKGSMMVMHYRPAEGAEDLFDRPTCITPGHAEDFRNLFRRAVKHSVASEDFFVMADAYRIFAEIEREYRQKREQPSPALERVKQYVDERIGDPDLRVAELAAMHKTSEVYFRREFKRFYGESPLAYIKRRRVEMACRLLCTELYSITEVATASGFDSISYFSSEFRRLMGCSPREYRER